MYGLNTNFCCCSIIKTPPIFDIYIVPNTGGIIYFFSALPLRAGDGVCKMPRLSPASPVPGASIAAAVVPAFIEGRVEGVEVPAVQMILHDSKSFTESLEMHDLSGAEKFDGIVDVRVVFDKAENVVVSDPGFLFCSEVFHQVCDRVAGGLESSRGERHAAGGLRPEAGGVIHIVIGEALLFNLFHGKITGELMNDGADHLNVV